MLKDFTKIPFDILIQAGQSNAEGTSFGEVDHPYQPDPRVWYLNPDMHISQATESVSGNDIQSNFSLTFATEYLKNNLLEEGRNLLILRCAVGGTGFLDNRWKQTDDLYLHMMEMIRTALALNPENRLVAFLWHQGETDALCHASYETHYHHLKTLLNAVLTEFHAPTLPFIAGDFVPHWKSYNMEICTPVLDAIRAVCDEYACAAFVESEGLLSNYEDPQRRPNGRVDTIHFSRNSIYELGERYFRAFQTVRQ